MLIYIYIFFIIYTPVESLLVRIKYIKVSASFKLFKFIIILPRKGILFWLFSILFYPKVCPCMNTIGKAYAAYYFSYYQESLIVLHQHMSSICGTFAFVRICVTTNLGWSFSVIPSWRFFNYYYLLSTPLTRL